VDQGTAGVTQRSRTTFNELITLPDLGIPLAEAALLVACEEYPHLKLGPYLDELDRLADGVEKRTATDSSPIETIAAINQVLFVEYGFEGNGQNYYDPRNSFLNDVIERRTGIPISLSAIYIEVARRIGFDIDGVGIPGHFLVKHVSGTEEIFIDPFNQGSILTVEDCRRLLPPGQFETDQSIEPWLRRVTNRQILTRMLVNLKSIYLQAQTFDKALLMLDLMILTAPDTLELYKERGLLRLQLRQFKGAAADLRWYLNHSPDSADNSKIESYLMDVNRIRTMMN
jgi:regulator of sirC expression with transglutaminase-like and TPR domain